jgi:hypothetical protein
MLFIRREAEGGGGGREKKKRENKKRGGNMAVERVSGKAICIKALLSL